MTWSSERRRAISPRAVSPSANGGALSRVASSTPNLIHLGMNMYVLYLIGGAMERVIGKLRFGLIYGVSLIGGSLGALILSPDTLTVGASGAVFGLFAALACLQLSRGQNPMQGGIGQTIVLNLVITFAFSSFISVGGHLGGLVVGGICGAILFGINPAQARSRASQLDALDVCGRARRRAHVRRGGRGCLRGLTGETVAQVAHRAAPHEPEHRGGSEAARRTAHPPREREAFTPRQLGAAPAS